MAQDYDIELRPITTYAFAIPALPNDEYVECIISYFYSSRHTIITEAWLHPQKNKLKQYFADLYEFEDYDNLSKEEIINKALIYFNNSETFNDSLSAIIHDDWDYFNIPTDGGKE